MKDSDSRTRKDLAELGGGLDLSNLSDRVYIHIKRLIMTGKLQGGQKIPEQAIAEQLGASRTPIREALRRLEEHGLVVIEPRRSTRVATITLDDKKHVGQVRLQLSLLAIRLLCERVSSEDCTTLRDLAVSCSEYAEAGDFASCFETDSLFHCEISERSGNEHLAELDRLLEHKVQLLRNIEKATRERVIETVSLHIPIVEAICLKDAGKAKELMYQHLVCYYPGLEAFKDMV